MEYRKKEFLGYESNSQSLSHDKVTLEGNGKV